MKILLPIDLVDPKRELNTISEALRQHNAFGGEFHLVNVIPEFNNKLFKEFYADNVGEQARSNTERLMQAFCQKYLPESLDYKTHIGSGVVYKEILQVAERIHADMIVMSASRPELTDYLLGPNTGKVVRHSNCSVLVVRAEH